MHQLFFIIFSFFIAIRFAEEKKGLQYSLGIQLFSSY